MDMDYISTYCPNVRYAERYGDERSVAKYARVCRGVLTDDERYSPSYVHYNTNDEKDENLIRTLIQSRHMTPFEFCGLILEIECPIFVARQVQRYRTSSFLERSLRLCEPLEIVESGEILESRKKYRKKIENGMPKELARMVLTLDEPTVFMWRIDLRNLLHFLYERLSDSAQRETTLFAQQIQWIVKNVFPWTYCAWKKFVLEKILEEKKQ